MGPQNTLPGVFPITWQRHTMNAEGLPEQKLHTIRTTLAKADASESVTSLAVAYFPNLGDFARYYRRQFGELPSQTLSRKRR